MAAEQVELGGLEVLQRLHGTPDTLGDLQEEPDLCCHVVELSLTFQLGLKHSFWGNNKKGTTITTWIPAMQMLDRYTDLSHTNTAIFVT